MPRAGRLIALQVLLVLGAFAICEVAYRAVRGVPIWTLENIVEATIAQHTNPVGPSVLDPVLGWVMRENYTSPTHAGRILTTGEFGIRMNAPSRILPVPRNGILAVGNSFVAGAEQHDDGSWPAALERILEEPVINSGVAGWGVDQIVLRAEQLQAPLAPHTILFGILDQDILRNAYDVFGAYKPYFEIEDGTLSLKGVPIPSSQFPVERGGLLRWIFGRSLIVHEIMMGVAAESWIHRDLRFRQVQTYEHAVEVSCLLLERIRNQLDAADVRPLIVLQYGGGWIEQADAPTWYGEDVFECAGELGIERLDTFAALKAIADADLAEFRSFYVMKTANGQAVHGHMSRIGNEFIAQLIAASFFGHDVNVGKLD